MKIYRPRRFGTLMVTHAYIKGPKSIAYSRLLVDTGATFTIISNRILQQAGYALTSREHQLIVTGSRDERLPVVGVEQFSCLGQYLENYDVLAHVFPSRVAGQIDGVLGMEFLKRFRIEIRPYADEIAVRN